MPTYLLIDRHTRNTSFPHHSSYNVSARTIVVGELGDRGLDLDLVGVQHEVVRLLDDLNPSQWVHVIQQDARAYLDVDDLGALAGELLHVRLQLDGVVRRLRQLRQLRELLGRHS